MTVLAAHQVCKTYGTTRALAPTDFSLRTGESVGIIGESGSGKTTLAKILLGLVRPDAGVVTYAGEPVTVGKLGPTPLRRNVQVVLQDPFASLHPRMRIGQIVAEPLTLLRIGGDRGARVRELLTQVGLEPDLSARLPHQLSGGQRQRVAIARALAPAPRVIIADEPVSALDVSVRVQILALLRQIVADTGLMLVVISHDIGVVQQLCTRTMVMAAGQVVESRPTAELLANPHHAATAALLDAVPRLKELA